MPEKVAVVGARKKFWDDPVLGDLLVRDIIYFLPRDTIIVSGHSGGGGVDIWAEEAAKALGMQTDIYPVDNDEVIRYGFPAAARMRNSRVVAACDRLVAIIRPGCSGTWDAYNKAKTAGKDARLVYG